MRTKPRPLSASDEYQSLEAELAELVKPALITEDFADVDALTEQIRNRAARADAIRLVLPMRRRAYLYEQLAQTRKRAAEAGNRLATAANNLYSAEAEIARMTQELENRHQAWAAEHVAAQNEATTHWNTENQLLEELRALGEDV